VLICALDAKKAFDVVPHPHLKFKLYNTPIRRSLWSLIDDLYSNNKEVIRWKGVDSNEYSVLQGVRQGGVLSTDLYKLFHNDNLVMLEESGLGLKIGATYVGCPTVADDTALLDDEPHEMQAMAAVCTDYSKAHWSELHPIKSTITKHVLAARDRDRDLRWYLGNRPLTTTTKFPHLGLTWKAGSLHPETEDRVTVARRTAYALMGVGLHGRDGLDPPASLSLVLAYVLPRMVHGLEATVLALKQLAQLRAYYKTLLRQLQGLPQNVATCAVYLLMGTLPLDAQLDKRYLSLFGAIARLESTNPLKLVAIRQLATKDPRSKSWFAHIRKIGDKYGINIDRAMTYPWPKYAWKRHVNTLVTHHWLSTLTLEAERRTTLAWLILDPSWIGRPHPLWQACKGKPFQVEAAAVRALLLTGRYGLQADRVHFTKQETSPICPLCQLEEEDAVHFCTACPTIVEDVKAKVTDLQAMYDRDGQRPPDSPREITSAILNGWAYVVDGSAHGQHNSQCNSQCKSQCNSQYNSQCDPQYVPGQPSLGSDHIVRGNTSSSTVPSHSSSHPKPTHAPTTHASNVLSFATATNSIVTLKANATPANQLCNIICYRLHFHRDIRINTLLLRRQQSPQKVGRIKRP
jgi:hypothetical protein